MPTAHCVSTLQGVIVAADQGFLNLVQRPEHEVVGKSYRTLTHPEDLGKSAHMLTTLVDRAAPHRLSKRYIRPDGSSVTASLFVTRFANPDRLISTLFWNEAGDDVRPQRLWEAARRTQQLRDVRKATFGEELTGDPAGALLVLIYLAEAEGRIIGIDALSRATGVTVSTTGRWIAALKAKGIVQPNDDNGTNVQFTQTGIMDMERTLEPLFDVQRSPSTEP